MFLYPILWAGSLLCLGYFACFICGLLYSIFFDKGKKRWLRPVIIGMGLLGLSPLLIIAFLLHHTLSDVSGNYQGSFGGGTDTFTLRSDGTFSQQFVTSAGRVYTSEGKWRISEIGFGPLDFDNIILPVDSAGRRQKPRLSNFRGAELVLLEPGITFPVGGVDDEDNGSNCIFRTEP